MRIAFTHNLQLNANEEEAEFDTRETVDLIISSLRSLGHHVEPVEVSGPASRTVARLEALAPDLVFNTAEGKSGRYREAFFPGLFEQLGIPHTGSDAYVCALTLDKQMTKSVLREHGVAIARGKLVTDPSEVSGLDLRLPVIVKPNFEGSSKGITQDSVVEEAARLPARVLEMLSRYPSGVLVEEYVVGRDVVVPFIEGISPETGGVLEAAEYEYKDTSRKYAIYDFDLKQIDYDGLSVKVPADLSESTRSQILTSAQKVFSVLGIRDAGRIDYRVAEDGTPYFLEVNALPSLESGASIYRSAALAGLGREADVLGAIVSSAARRYGLSEAPRRHRSAALRVGLTFNLKRAGKQSGTDREAEYDSPETIASLRAALESLGHQVVELEATAELPALLPASGVDVVFNIAEGIKGRHREALVPAMLELLDIPYTGSDPSALTLALDKALAKRLVSEAGVPTAAFAHMTTGREKLPRGFRFPAVVKPIAEGSSKGIAGAAVARSEQEARSQARAIIERYAQAAMVEEYLPGREFTVGLLGERRPRVLPPMEIVFTAQAGDAPLYTYDYKLDAGEAVRYEVPANVSPELHKTITRSARTVFAALGCRDVARVDFRLDAEGKLNFIECNPLPGLTPGWSDLCVIAEHVGMDYRTLVAEILAPALRRHRELKRRRPRPA